MLDIDERALLFVDGNNWYHALATAGVPHLGKLSYAKIANKLTLSRRWIGLRNYIGQVQQVGNTRLYAEQRRFLSGLQRQSDMISVHLGRLEQRSERNDLADKLLSFLAGLSNRGIRLSKDVYQDLFRLVKQHEKQTVVVEKAVDVMLAVDLVVMAQRDEYDTAYLLSADGDYTHGVSFVRGLGKKVFAVSVAYGAELARVANTFIRLKPDWFRDCYCD